MTRSALRHLAARLALFIGLGLAWAGQSGTAFAGTFSVSPTRLTLSPRATSAVLTLTNESDHAIHFHLSAFAWDQMEDGRMALADTSDIVFHPPLVTLEPGESRRIRVGATVPSGDLELTYRLFVEELPDETASAPEGHVQVRTRMGIPIFVQPRAPAVHATLDQLAVAGGLLSFELRNDGTRHTLAQTIRVRGRSPAGREVFTQRVDGWYLLARHRQLFQVALPDECGGAASLEVEVGFDHGTATERIDLPSQACQSR